MRGKANGSILSINCKVGDMLSVRSLSLILNNEK
jgi:hypothetical protein